MISTTNKTEAIDMLREAQLKIEQAIGALEQAAYLDPENSGWAHAYLIDHLQAISNKVGHDQSIDDWIEALENGESDEEDDD